MYHREIKSILAVATVFCAFANSALKANPITVTEAGIGTNDTVYINSSTLGSDLHVYAGIVDLTLGTGPSATSVDSFCIDPWHWSVSGPQSYQSELLSHAPKPPGPMSAAAAVKIEQLWEEYMTSSFVLSSNSHTADEWSAAMQLEIWQTVAGSVSGATYSLVSVDNNFSGEATAVLADLANMNTFLADATSSTLKADLEAVTSGISRDGKDNPGQDYVIATGGGSSGGGVPTPDGGTTAALLGVSVLGILALGRGLRNSSSRIG